MKILHVLDHSLPLHSGYTFRTAAILREQRARGWETVHLTTPRQKTSGGDMEEAGGLVFHRTPMRSTARSWLPAVGRYLDEMASTERRLDEMVRVHRPDILHAHSPVLDALPALAVGRRHHIPVVYEVRAFWEDAAVDHHTTTEGSARYRITRALETYALRKAQGVAVICDGLRRDIEARGIPRARMVVIPNAVDADRFRADLQPDAGLRRQLKLDGKTVLGFLGSFYAYEGLELLLEAFALLKPVHPELHVLLAGGGPEENALRARASSLGISESVLFTGRIDHADIDRYYALVDLLVYPRLRMRLTDLVTPLKPLEAMAQGRIQVASDVGGHRELIADGETGYLFPAGNARALSDTIARTLAQRDRWSEMRVRARRFVEEQRTWKHSVAGYAPLYAALTAGATMPALARAAN
jgi:glycogen synthase